ncbi:MAG: UMP kinase [Spirochaetae bacterium HGW-Spirochaetae-1]|jgi:uridylate kinase|nr:MAG: UMP kinase [Spirochaetae bacterium HGW-Spirochaetae-1]
MKSESGSRYKRILLKLSGEALAGEEKTGINPKILADVAGEIRDITASGVEVAMVIGAGNIFRGSLGEKLGIDRATGDYMGMLATVMNSLAMQNALEQLQVPARVMTALEMKEVAEHYSIRKALSHLEKGRVVIAAGGTGHPFFTTDTASSLRAIELGADVMLKATRVDGVYTSDPEKDPSARKIDSISYIDVIQKQLRVLDLTSVSLCMDNKLPIIVFNLFDKGSLKKVVMGEKIGTLIS